MAHQRSVHMLTRLAMITALLATNCSASQVSQAQEASVPPGARAAGYLRQTFRSEGFNTKSVDQGQSYRPGYHWYHWNFFGPPIAASGNVLNPDGTASLTRGYANGNLVSAARTPDGKSWHGVAFGGGFYAEAELAFDAQGVDTDKGWPAWWSMALEHMIQDGSSHWAGRERDYEHFAELDFMEYLHGRTDVDSYGATFHDWYGQYNRTCPGFCDRRPPDQDAKVKAPQGTDWSRFHRYAVRVIPATSVSLGQIDFYMDDKRVGQKFTYRPLLPESGSAAGWAKTAGIIDQQHMVLVLGAGATPLRVRSVRVWQASSAGNLTR